MESSLLIPQALDALVKFLLPEYRLTDTSTLGGVLDPNTHRLFKIILLKESLRSFAQEIPFPSSIGPLKPSISLSLDIFRLGEINEILT